MNNGARLLELLQGLQAQGMASADLSDWCLGVVESASPLTVRIENKDVVTEDFLVLTDAVRDYEVDITVNHVTENRAGGGGYAEYESHNHDYKGRKKIIVHNALTPGETVILIRQAGGQGFVVLSRAYNHAAVTGEWG